MLERRESSALDKLHAAIQEFSNSLADTPDDVGMVTHALVAWEEVSLGDDGTAGRATLYAATGDTATPNASLGLSLHLLRTIEHDVIGGCSD